MKIKTLWKWNHWYWPITTSMVKQRIWNHLAEFAYKFFFSTALCFLACLTSVPFILVLHLKVQSGLIKGYIEKIYRTDSFIILKNEIQRRCFSFANSEASVVSTGLWHCCQLGRRLASCKKMRGEPGDVLTLCHSFFIFKVI